MNFITEISLTGKGPIFSAAPGPAQGIMRPWKRHDATGTTDFCPRQLDIGLDNVPELAADRVLWRGLIRGAIRTALVHATDDDGLVTDLLSLYGEAAGKLV